MKDGFGLKYLHKFFSIPFLHLQVRFEYLYSEVIGMYVAVNNLILFCTARVIATATASEQRIISCE